MTVNKALRKVRKGDDGQGRMVLREGAVQRRGRGTDADATLCAVDKHFAEDEHPDRGPTSFCIHQPFDSQQPRALWTAA